MEKQSQSSKGSGVSRVSDLIRDRCPLDVRAEQSQFATTMPIRRSAFPGGQTCETKPIRPRGGRVRVEAIVRNKANLPAVGIPHHSIIPLFQRSNPMPIVQNKANSSDSQARFNCRSGKSLRDKMPVLCLRKTKPISPRMDRAIAGATGAKQSQFSAGGHGRPSARPKALRLPPILGDNCAKQSQFRATVSSLKSQVVRGRRQALAGTGVTGEPSRITSYGVTTNAAPGVRNTGNWPAVGLPIIPLFHYSTVPIRCRLCKAKPISATMPIGRSAFPEGRTCKTEPIRRGVSSLKFQVSSRRSRRSGLQTSHFKLPADCFCVQTKPISASRIYRAKQSQFASGGREDHRQGRGA